MYIIPLHYGADGGVVDELIARGELVKYSDKRHARYGLPQGTAEEGRR